MEQGDIEPPILYTSNVLRNAKQTQRDAALGIVEGAHTGINVDNSPALKSDVVRSFGRSVDINDYLQKSCLALSEEGNKLTPCYLKLDVAHFILSAKKWKLWRNKGGRKLKDFYLRCLGLLIKIKSLIDFQEVLPSHERLSILSTVESSLAILFKNIKGDEIKIYQDEEVDIPHVEEQLVVIAMRIVMTK
ncbi:hypothetical protein J6590_077617 [Homalodisca vitripennis]|nr:hypothetical protein J6590_077617 [Homalodisca vitripennis]